MLREELCDTDAVGLNDAEGLADADGLADRDELCDAVRDGDALTDADGLSECDELADADGLTDAVCGVVRYSVIVVRVVTSSTVVFAVIDCVVGSSSTWISAHGSAPTNGARRSGSVELYRLTKTSSIRFLFLTGP